MRDPLSPEDSSGHLDDRISATCPSRFLVALDASCWFSPPAPSPSSTGTTKPSRGRQPITRLPLTRASRHGFRFRRVLCVALRAGAGGGGKREAALRRLRSPHSRTRSREGRCCPVAALGPWGLPLPAGSARRVPAPRDCVTGPPHVTTAASARLGPGRTFCRPGYVSASGVAWLPRRSPVPLPLASRGETLTPSPRVSAAS